MHDTALATAIRRPEGIQRRSPCGSVNVSGKFPQRGLAAAITYSGSLREGALAAAITSPEGPKAPHAIRFAMDGLVLEGSGGGERIFLEP